MASTSKINDNFTLYDLRVEVVCPEGERILCGAKRGDHFTLEGEMLYLPPGQGISIYSLGMYGFFIFHHEMLSDVLTWMKRLCSHCWQQSRE
jgi:hypothetical protein